MKIKPKLYNNFTYSLEYSKLIKYDFEILEKIFQIFTKYLDSKIKLKN